MRVPVHVIGIETDTAQQTRDTLATFALRALFVNHERLGNDVANLHTRIQRRVRILKNDLHLAPHLAQLFLPKRENVASLKKNLARGDRKSTRLNSSHVSESRM